MNSLSSLDAAALHPDLWDKAGGHYYQKCAEIRSEIKHLLGQQLAIKHDLYLLSNTTHGLVVAMAGLALEGIFLEAGMSTYPPYSKLPHWPHGNGFQSTSLLTHVDPITGSVDDISKSRLLPVIVDAAQSFATLRYHSFLNNTDIFLCPLHKHAGVIAGLGLFAINTEFIAPSLRALVATAEIGTNSLCLLAKARKRITTLDERLFNTLILPMGNNFQERMAKRGIELLTPPDAELPFICLKGANPQKVVQSVRPLGLSVKYFSRYDITRISGSIRGSFSASPVDVSSELERALLQQPVCWEQ